MRVLYALTLLSAFSPAAELMPQAGQWEVVSEMPAEQKAMFSKMKPEQIKQMQQPSMHFDPKAGTITMSLCLSKEKMGSWQQMGQKPSQNCEPPKVSNSGNTVSMDMQCRQPHAATIHSVIQFSPARDSYQYEHQIQAQGKSMALKGSARRLGECK
ncbi:DUF3617 family protein [Iodobacter sp. CM08]|uniref:DUF3617 domain-containing protein n=1 Tax=Iodobacter sp. CM08 TaxID=3085902 RepID=UPI0029826CFA|nr:DUF3617 family protein [Iodobacter sp. CM08]MDW5416282.1 DUF3617 family protein [Iodobacter sp. CM08]